MFDLCRTLPKYLRTFLHKNALLTNWSNGPIRLQHMPNLWLEFSSIQYSSDNTNIGNFDRVVVELNIGKVDI